MRRAWGESRTQEERRRIVSAALLFGELFEEKMTKNPPGLMADEQQRFLMALMNDVVRSFARQEGMDQEEAMNFLSDIGTRDLVLEFNEVLEAHAADESGRTLDQALRKAIESRQDKAVWSRHFSSG